MSTILLIRLSAIGDIVFASPLIAALRRAYPNARIVWLVQAEYRALLDHHPDLDDVIACPLRHWRQLWRERHFGALLRSIWVLRATLQSYNVDLAIDLQGLLKSGLLTWLSAARERIGLGSREGSQWLMTRTVPRGGIARQIGSEYRYLAETLRLPTDDWAMAVHYSATEAAFIADMLLEKRITQSYAVLCPFTTRPQKHWFEDRWLALAARLQAELGLTPLLLGGAAEHLAATRMTAASSGQLVNLVGKTSLTEAAALIDQAALVIAVDTGLGHIGIALNTPSLLLFGSTRPYLDTGRTNAQVLYHALPCSPCKRHPTCDGKFDCLRQISVDTVINTAKRLIKNENPSR
ncbi:glycosyltransferase family 9 protein [Chromatium okenii]|uniref:glycosyltransferase family 9 protein n=1 Tax=Chromatium okenii TaxID=61644 RepID=UPI0026ECB2D4|nr:glycosyltransferase family 9 protein [Chromatium okenii]MBV5308652.1 glycosyltransferase family 9 protein [Chromatium okenii]